jgi:hypothetical protein
MGQIDQTIQALLGKRCAVCGKKKRLERAHIPAKSKGGRGTIPMCHDDHLKHDQGKLTRSEQKRLGYKTRASYTKARPKRKPRRGLFDEIW